MIEREWAPLKIMCFSLSCDSVRLASHQKSHQCEPALMQLILTWEILHVNMLGNILQQCEGGPAVAVCKSHLNLRVACKGYAGKKKIRFMFSSQQGTTSVYIHYIMQSFGIQTCNPPLPGIKERFP